MRNTIVDMVFQNAERLTSQTAMNYFGATRWERVSWAEYADGIRKFGAALLACGYEPGWGLAILGDNRPEWLISHLGGMAVRALPTGIYQTSTADQIAYILNHAEVRVVVVDSWSRWERISEKRDVLPLLKLVVLLDAEGHDLDDDLLVSWDDFLAMAGPDNAAFETRFEALDPEDLATLIYTSGTTGPPKGVMLSHQNLAWTSRQTRRAIGGEVSDEDCVVSYLPLSHIAEQMFSIYLAAAYGYPIWFSPSLEALKETLIAARPTLFLAVPRVWEKFKAALESQLETLKGPKAKLVQWARGVGEKTGNDLVVHGQPSGLARIEFALAEKLFFKPLKAKLGLDAMKVAVTGAAPIGKEVLDFFLSCGIIIHEVYGQSEDSGPTSFNQPFPGERRLGTVGRPFPGVDVRIADDGEILVRGPNVFQGYYKDPDATDQTLVDGWLHSGDIGEFDADGFLRITDRKKDIIVTAGGKNVAPQNIEKLIRSIDGVSQAVVVGDRRKYLSALITLCPDKAPHLPAAKSHTSLEETAASKAFHNYMSAEIDARVNGELARYEQIKTFRLIGADFSQENGELTPTQKLKRNVIVKRHASLIDEMYPDA